MRSSTFSGLDVDVKVIRDLRPLTLYCTLLSRGEQSELLALLTGYSEDLKLPDDNEKCDTKCYVAYIN